MTSLQPLFIDLAVKGTLLLVLAFAAAALLRRCSAATRHLNWQLALAGLLALPLVAAVTPRVAVPAGPLAALLDSEPARPAANRTRPALLHERQRVAADDLREVGRSQPEARESSPSQASPAPPPASAAPRRAAEQPRVPLFTLQLLDSPRELLLALWAAGAAVVLVTLLTGVLRARALARSTTPVVDPEWLALADRVRCELSLHRAVDLRRAPDAIVPLTFGWRRPVVLLPADADRWCPSRRRHVLLHELAHVRRGDWLGQMVAQAACALWWWQPLAWLASRELRRQRELACDDAVLSAGSRASEYADHLLAIAASRCTRGVTGVATLAMARRSQLEGRLLAVLEAGRRRAAPGRRRALAASGAAAALVLALACVQPSGDKPESPAAGAPSADSPPTDAGNPIVAIAPGEAQHLRTPQPGPAPLAPRARSMPPPAPGEPALAPLAGREMLIAPGEPAPLALMPGHDPFAFEMDGMHLKVRNLAGLGYVNVCGDDSTSIWSWSVNDESWTVIQKGEVSPDATGKRIEWMDEDASFTLRHAHGGVSDQLDAVAAEDEDGDSTVAWNGTVGGRPVSGDAALAEADKLMAVALEQTGLFASQRVARLVDEKGTQGAVQALAAMPAGSGRDHMLRALLMEHELDTPEFAAALELAAQSEGGESALAEVLECVGPDALGDSDLVEPIFHAVESIDSDATQCEVLVCLLCSDAAESPVLARGLQAAATGIESDAYAAELLQQVPASRLRDAGVRDAWLAVLVTIESDAYMAETLGGVIGERAAKGETATALIVAATRIDSDAYMAELLEQVPSRMRGDAALRDPLLAALATIESDAYAAEVCCCWLCDEPRADFTAALLRGAGATIDSDAYLAEVLQNVPDELLEDAAVRSAYEAAAGSIQSQAYAQEVRQRLLEDEEG
jgi:beta-lactamase regulating signal transducer with metallopeptidase domain